MPVYEYYCNNCEGSFSQINSILNYKKPLPCPSCGSGAKRVIYSAPNLNSMKADTRKAYQINEKSAHEPRVSNGHGHTCNARCNHGDNNKQAEAQTLKQQNKQRPWMLGH